MDPYVEVREDNYESYLWKLKRTVYKLDDPIWPLISVHGRYSERKAMQFLNDLTDSKVIDRYQFDYLYVLLRIATTEFEPHTTHDQPYDGYVHAVCPEGEREKQTLQDLIRHADNNEVLEIAGMFYECFLGDQADREIADFLIRTNELNSEYIVESRSSEEYDQIFDARYKEDLAFRKDIDETMKELDNMPDSYLEELDNIDMEEVEEEDRKKRENEFEELKESFPNKKEFISHLISFTERCHKRTDPRFGGYFNRTIIFGDIKGKLDEMIRQYQKDHGATLFGNRETMININSALIKAGMYADRARRAE